jgi:hypothetical protein
MVERPLLWFDDVLELELEEVLPASCTSPLSGADTPGDCAGASLVPAAIMTIVDATISVFMGFTSSASCFLVSLLKKNPLAWP